MDLKKQIIFWKLTDTLYLSALKFTNLLVAVISRTEILLLNYKCSTMVHQEVCAEQILDLAIDLSHNYSNRKLY